MQKVAVAVLSMVSLAGLVSGCGGSSSYGSGGMSKTPPTTPTAPTTACTAASATATTSVSLSGMEFVPSCVKVAAGTMITFQNADSIAHTVTTDAGQPETFDSGALTPRTDFTHTFATAETVHLHCSIHPSMTATIIVQ